jgi:PAS domain S-box-containing protein
MYKEVLGEKKIWNKIITNRGKNGDLYYVDSFIKANFDNTGKLKGFISIRQDVTQIKVKEQEIRNRMNAINKSNLVIEFDLDGNIIFANSKFLELTGYRSKEIVGKNHSIFMIEEDLSDVEYCQKFWKRLSNGEFISDVFRRKTKNGENLWIRATYNPIFDVNDRVYRVLKIAVDVTESVQQKEELMKKNTYLEHAAKILRHDMHSGINTYIPRGISSLERRLKDINLEELKLDNPIKLIKEGLKHTQKVYNGVYEFTNLVKEDAVLDLKECNVKKILLDFLGSTSYKSQVLISDDIPNIVCNEALFCTAIDNLIRNGLKYNDSPKKMIKIYFENKYIVIEDNGRGLTQEEFDEYSKGYRRKNNQKEGGTGLGLNICKAILDEHDFEISVEKLEPNGTKLKIKI